MTLIKLINLWVKKGIVFRWIFFFVMLSACQTAPIAEAPIKTATLYITPYYTPTTYQTDLPTPKIGVTATPRPIPTVTPFTYTVVQGDTMLAIAMRYGISLGDLMEANPEVNPSILPIGTVLIIPMIEDNQEVIPSPTPIPMVIGEPICYQSAEGGMWCFLLVENVHNEAVENVSARLALVDLSGDLVVESEATTPLNVLPEFRSMPIMVYFPPPLPDGLTPQADLVSVLPLSPDNSRYLEASVEMEFEQISDNNIQAVVSGYVSLVGGQDPATLVWLAVVAYDEQGVVVGVRKWEAYFSDTEDIPEQAVRLEKPLQVGRKLPFEVTVYSFGLPIASIDILVEARP
jgi:hypothetical protein